MPRRTNFDSSFTRVNSRHLPSVPSEEKPCLTKTKRNQTSHRNRHQDSERKEGGRMSECPICRNHVSVCECQTRHVIEITNPPKPSWPCHHDKDCVCGHTEGGMSSRPFNTIEKMVGKLAAKEARDKVYQSLTRPAVIEAVAKEMKEFLDKTKHDYRHPFDALIIVKHLLKTTIEAARKEQEK